MQRWALGIVKFYWRLDFQYAAYELQYGPHFGDSDGRKLHRKTCLVWLALSHLGLGHQIITRLQVPAGNAI